MHFPISSTPSCSLPRPSGAGSGMADATQRLARQFQALAMAPPIRGRLVSPYALGFGGRYQADLNAPAHRYPQDGVVVKVGLPDLTVAER